MTGQIVVRNSVSSVASGGSMRRQPLLSSESPPPATRRVAEVAGVTAAECAAVCCCCPCGLVDLLLVAVVKLPAGLCRRAISKRRRKMRAKRASGELPSRRSGDDEMGVEILTAAEDDAAGPWPPEKSPSAIVSAMEKEMWAKFYSSGFWRNPSHREEDGHGHGGDEHEK